MCAWRSDQARVAFCTSAMSARKNSPRCRISDIVPADRTIQEEILGSWRSGHFYSFVDWTCVPSPGQKCPRHPLIRFAGQAVCRNACQVILYLLIIDTHGFLKDSLSFSLTHTQALFTSVPANVDYKISADREE